MNIACTLRISTYQLVFSQQTEIHSITGNLHIYVPQVLPLLLPDSIDNC
jgi:hypothetical protein